MVIGASWGGLDAITAVLSGVGPSSKLAVAIAQHRAPADSMLAELLAKKTGWRVCDADDKEVPVAGRAYLAPAGYHLLIDDQGFALSVDEPVHHSRPSVDVLFESAADVYGGGLIAVVLTGSNDDGAAGLAHVLRRGGLGIVQDPATAEKREMPEAAIAVGPDRVLPLNEIGPFVAELCATKEDA